MWHGGGLTGACWETTPDGRPGFRDIFLAGGWDVFVSDAVERGRSGFAPVPDVWGPPISQTIETVFERFRIGAYLPKGELARASQHVYPGTAFPVEALDRFAAQMVPRWTNTNGYILDAYLEELEATGPAVILAHSQGCVFALEAAARRPDLVAALVLLEPAAIPELPASFIAADLPMLVMLGDFIERSKRWMKMQRDITRFVSCNDHAELLQLPEHGLEGNSHMLMMDRTSDKVAELIMNWLAKQELSV
ncbi:alpha/beta fold hydrolase [Sulfitobacter sp. NFXS29]